MKSLLKLTLGIGFLVVLLSFTVSLAGAQCWTCSGDPLDGDPPPDCVTTGGAGFLACTLYPAEPWCKLSGSSCGGGGGDGDPGPCATWTQPIRVPGQSVATVAELFQTDAATNAHVFGGRGHGVRVISGGAFGGVSTDRTAGLIRQLSDGKAGVLPLALAFTNFNNGGVALTIGRGSVDGVEFAAVSDGMAAHLEVHWKGARQLERAIENADLMPDDLLLLDVSIDGKAFILALNSKSLDLRAADVRDRASEIQRNFTQDVRSYPMRIACPCRIPC